MTHDLDLAPPPPTPATAPRFRLRYGPIFWRVALVGLVVLEVVFWLKHVRPRVPFRPRIVRVVLMAYVTPRLLFYAVLVAAIVTVVSDLVFRLLVRPLMRGWYHPHCFDPTSAHPLPFLLGVGEEVLEERPARRVAGRRKQPGTLVRTNRRAYFFPFAWDVERWSLPFEHVESARLVTPRRRVLGWVSGYPDHLVVADDSGESTTLILADPRSALAWFAGSDSVTDGRPVSDSQAVFS